MTKTKTRHARHIAEESRTCFGILYFATEADAIAAGEEVKRRGDTYNGGWFHGMLCGRDYSFDRTVDGVKQYAVTVA